MQFNSHSEQFKHEEYSGKNHNHDHDAPDEPGGYDGYPDGGEECPVVADEAKELRRIGPSCDDQADKERYGD